MNIDELTSPIQGKADLLNQQFDAWWVALNSLGAVSFGFFLACLGTNEHKHNSAILCLLLIIWLRVAGQDKFPAFIRRLRARRTAEAAMFENAIWADYFSFLRHSVAYFPMWLGLGSLMALAIYPMFFGEFEKYLYIFG